VLKQAPAILILLLIAILVPGGAFAAEMNTDDFVVRINGDQSVPAHRTGEGIYMFPLVSDPPTLDPAQGSDTTSDSIIAEIFDGLVELDESLIVGPCVADKWEVTDDGLVYTFHLRKDVKFHNGRQVKAQDFKYTFERILNPRVASKRNNLLFPIKGSRRQGATDHFDVEGIKVIDDFTLQLVLDAPYTPFIQHLTMSNLGVVPREEVERVGDDQFTTRPIGCGPFKFVSREGTTVELAAFDDYYRGKPKLKGIRYRVISEAASRLSEFKSGNLDHTDIPPGNLRTLQADPEMAKLIRVYPQLAMDYFGFNMEREPFKGNPDLRIAFNHAVDKAAICEKLEDRRVPFAAVLPPGIPGYNPDLEGYPYDPELAREYLELAGYPNGEGLPTIEIMYNVVELNKIIAESIAADLGRIGVKTQLRALEWAAYIDAVDKGEPQIFRMGWVADYPDADNFLYVLFSSRQTRANGNASAYSNPDFDELVERAQVITDHSERIELYQEAEQIIMEDAPWMFLFYSVNYLLVQPWVDDMVLGPMDSQSTISRCEMEKVALR